MAKNKKKKWCKPRHAFFTELIRLAISPFVRWKYHCRVKPFREAQKRPLLILFNHQTGFDQFFVGKAFDRPIYYVATEDIFSMGFVSGIIRYLVAPIPIKKQTTDVQAILNCMRVAREGGTIAIAPEGNRTYSGRTGYMSPSIVPLARKLGLPIVLYRIEGGYGIQPRWSDSVRKGKMQAYVARVIEPAEYAEMSDDELFEQIRAGLWVDEATVSGEYRGKKRAEYLERAIYTCPTCGLATWQSRGEVMECTKCHQRVRYLPTKELCSTDGEFPFRFVADWYDWQTRFLSELDLTALVNEPVRCEQAALFEVAPYQRKKRIAKRVTVSLYGDRVTLAYGGEEVSYSFDALSAAVVLGKNKLNLYFDGHIYQLKGNKSFNALQFVHFYHQYQNNKKGVKNGFLGI
ncbi:MAG: 1-acyl-sn-glycerol-3-phosphate acyltransferase [Clostridia bacterium]|nr:1-acyl-sn-glycerol-3-phosphate acyltransferase [Clostridia bacterium]